MRSSRSRSVIDRYCLKPAMWSRTSRPSGSARRSSRKPRSRAGPQAGPGQTAATIPSQRCIEERTPDANAIRKAREATSCAGICRRRRVSEASHSRAADHEAPHDTRPGRCRARSAAATRRPAPDSAANRSRPAIAQPRLRLNSFPSYLSFRTYPKLFFARKVRVVLLLHHDRIAGSARVRQAQHSRLSAERGRSAGRSVSSSENRPFSSSTRRTWPFTPMSTRAAANVRSSVPILDDVAHRCGLRPSGGRTAGRRSRHGGRARPAPGEEVESREADQAEPPTNGGP